MGQYADWQAGTGCRAVPVLHAQAYDIDPGQNQILGSRCCWILELILRTLQQIDMGTGDGQLAGRLVLCFNAAAPGSLWTSLRHIQMDLEGRQ